MALEDVAAEIKAAKSAAAARKLKAPEKKAPEDTAPQKKVSAPPSAEAQRLAKAAEQAKKLTADIKALGEESTKVGEDALAAVLVTAKGIDNIAARQMGLQGKALPSGEQIGKGSLPDFKPGQTFVPPEVGGPMPTGAAAGAATGAAIAKPMDEKTAERRSAFALLRSEFDRYGLGDLVGDIQSLAEEGISPSEFSLRLRQTQPYQQRFAANQQRINKGLRALSVSYTHLTLPTKA